MAEKILVVDDEKVICEVLSKLLSQNGYAVDVCGNGKEAVQRVKENSAGYACVLTDVKMPQMDGIEFLKQSQKISPATPVIIVTGAATVDIAVEALKRGAVALIEKPFNNEKVLNTVREILSLRGKSDRKQHSLPYLEKRWTVECPGAKENLASIIEILVMGMQDLEIITAADENPARDALKHALENAVEHGNEGNIKKLIRVNAVANNKTIRVGIEDEGAGFNPLEYIEEDNLNEAAWKKGKGLFKIYSVVDEVTFNAKGNRINLLWKKRNAT